MPVKLAKIKPLKLHEVYVVVVDKKPWTIYPLSADVVRQGTITTIYEPVNDSPFVLICHNSPPSLRQVERKHIFIFSYDAHAKQDGTYGLTPALE